MKNSPNTKNRPIRVCSLCLGKRSESGGARRGGIQPSLVIPCVFYYVCHIFNILWPLLFYVVLLLLVEPSCWYFGAVLVFLSIVWHVFALM